MLTFMEKWRIKNSARNRSIKNLIHFTDIRNIESIIRYGILTRSSMDEKQIAYFYNDSFRYDNLNGAISLSVTFPNYKMFYRLRCDNPEKRWVVISLKAEEILKLDCVFCKTNAANNEMVMIPVNQRKTYRAFENMFYERSDITRKELSLPSNFTTDPQAEILVCENLPPNYINGIYVANIADVNYLKDLGVEACVDEDYFLPRWDYSKW